MFKKTPLFINSKAGSAVIAELNVTPTTSAQTITAPEGTDGYNPVNVSAVTASIDANIQAENIKKDVTILGVAGTYAPSAGKKYQMFQRVKDDSNNDIGCVAGFHIDANNQEYAVICLNAQYRATSVKLLDSGNATDITPTYEHDAQAFSSNITATEFNDKFLTIAQTAGTTSSAITHCRAQTFTIDGVRYSGQVPTILQLSTIIGFRDQINNADPTLSDNPGLAVNYATSPSSCTPRSIYAVRAFQSTGALSKTVSVSNSMLAIPILELPNA